LTDKELSKKIISGLIKMIFRNNDINKFNINSKLYNFIFFRRGIYE
jgi:hypothetical protein